MKKFISLLLSVLILFSISTEALAAYEGDKAHSYESADCTIVYTVTNEWTGNQQISVSITNNSEETLRNWAIKFDNTGIISNIWNAAVLKNDGELCVIRNNGYNYEIIPGETVEFGFMQQGDSLSLPENIVLCSKTADSTASAEISYEIQNNWGEGFIAAVTVKNISNEPLEAWKLCFNGNFEISSIWNANLLYTEDDSFKVENDVTTTPIAVGETKTFSFEGAIVSGEEPVMSDFVLTSIVIDMEAESDDSNSDETDESDETGEAGETGESGETGEADEPTNPTEPTVPEIEMILCFGEYIAEENVLEVYWYSTNESAVSVYENTDDCGWVKLAEVADEDSYKYEATEDFLVKHIKVKQDTENGMIESEPFIVAYTENGYICTWADTDADGLADYIEELYGTDPENPDTDSDSLSDYDEIYTVGTSPLKYDTDEDRINDADSDLDSDELTNAQELELGTSPSYADTDSDELSDYAELYETNTDPLKADSDGDTLNDGDDIELGFDPNNPETFGTPDAEYKFEQVISAESEIMSDINTEEAPYEVSLEITASGNAAANLAVNTDTYSAVTESSARLGEAVSFEYYGGDVEKVKLIYEIGEDYISNDGSEYAENCVDLQGIKRYNVFRYFEEINMLLPVATEFDEENNTLYAVTDELGTYCVLDMEVLLENFGIAPDGTQTETVMAEYYSAAETVETAEYAINTAADEIVSEAETENDGYADSESIHVSFIIDIRTDGLSASDFAGVKSEIDAFAKRAYLYERDLVVHLLTQSETNFEKAAYKIVGEYKSYDDISNALSKIKQESKGYIFGGCCNISEALNAAIGLSEPAAKNYIFDVYAQKNAIYEYDIADMLSAEIRADDITIGIISEYEDSFIGYQQELLTTSRGVVYNRFVNLSDSIYNLIWHSEDVLPTKTYPFILSTGYRYVQLNSKLYPQGANPSGADTDTDGDGLIDWKEVKNDLLIPKGDGYALPTVSECVRVIGDVPFYVECALSESEIKYKYWSAPILPINSDPTEKDGDGDYLYDNSAYSVEIDGRNIELAPKDPNPLKVDGIPELWKAQTELGKHGKGDSDNSDYIADIQTKCGELVDPQLTREEADAILTGLVKCIAEIAALIIEDYSTTEGAILELEEAICLCNIGRCVLNGPMLRPVFFRYSVELSLWINHARATNYAPDNFDKLVSLYNLFETGFEHMGIELPKSITFIGDWLNAIFEVKSIFHQEQFNPIIPQEHADVLVKAATNLRSFILQHYDELRPHLLELKESFESTPELSAYLTNFQPDESGKVYHSQVETWQKPFGYNNMYDDIFRTASNMHYLPLHFDSEGTEYVLWLWKGDYWGLQGGAEIGLYCDFENNEYNNRIEHFHVVEFELPMTLSLYEYINDTTVENKFSWVPEENQWWITGFDSSFTNPVPDNMGVVGSVDFSDEIQLYADLRDTYYHGIKFPSNMDTIQYNDGVQILVFDDNSHTVWIIWRETESC